MSTDEINIEIAARVAKLQQTLESIPGIGGKAAKKLTNDVAKEWRALERRTKSSQEKIAKEWEQKLDTIKRGSEKVFGGVIGDVEDVGKGLMALSGTAGGLAGAFGIAGLATAGVVVGAVAATDALFGVVSSAQAARARLEEIGGTEPLPEATIEALDDWRDGALGMEVAGKRLHVLLAGELAGAFGELPYIMAGTASQFGTLTEYASTFDGTLTALSYTLTALDLVAFGGRVVGLSEAFAGATEEGHAFVEQQKVRLQIETNLKKAMEQATEESEAYRAEQLELAETLGVVVDLEEDWKWKTERLAEAKRDQAEATREAAEAARQEADDARAVNDAIRERLAATQALAGVLEDSASDTLTAEDKVRAAYQARVDAINAAALAAEDADATAAALAAAEQRRLRDLHALKEEQAADLAEQDEAAAKRAREQAQALAEQRVASVGQIGDAYMALTDLIAQGDEEMSDRQKALALAAFRANQTGAVSMIAVNAAVAIMRALADLGPIAGPVAAGAIGVTAGVQTAAVLKQKPPEFPMGGVYRMSPDHALVGVQDEEGIVNRRGMRDLGEDRLNRLNAGMGLGGDGPVVVEQRYRHRVFDRFVRDNLRQGGPLSQALTRRRKPGHSNRG